MFAFRRIGLLAGVRFKVGSVTINNVGDYGSPPTCTFTGGGGTGAAGTVNTSTFSSSGEVTTVNIQFISGYYSLASAFPTISITGGGGSGATAEFTSWTTGYFVGGTGVAEVSSSSVTFSVTGGGGSGGAMTQTGLQWCRARAVSATIGNPGSGYTTAPTVVFTPRGGINTVTPPTGTATTNGSQITGVTITNSGTNDFNRDNLGPTIAFDISFTGGGGSGANATVRTSDLNILSWWAGPDASDGSGPIGYSRTLGSGYTSDPTLTVSPLVGSNTIVGKAGRQPVSPATVTNGGSGYTSSPTATDSGGTPAFGTVTLDLGAFGSWGTRYRVDSITVTNQGANYTSAPTINFVGGSPATPAVATANMVQQ